MYLNSTTLKKIHEASRSTGLRLYYLREGCKNGSIPCIKSGKVYFIDVPALLDKLRVQAESEVKQV